MASRAVRELLAQDIGLWLADGLVSQETRHVLSERYQAREFGIAKVIKSLGIAGGLLAFYGLLGMVAALSGSKVVEVFLLLAVGGAMTAWGIRLSIDPLGRYALSSKVVLMFGVVASAVGVGVGLNAAHFSGNQVVVATGPLILAPMGILAYRYRNNFLLVIGLITLFHWIGSWTGMLGRSTYAIDIQDPRSMSLAALAVVLAGVWHERELREQTGRFYQVYEAVGLVYLDLSLLILSIAPEDFHAGHQTFWIVVLAAAAIGQIAAGARLHNPLLTGFGVTAFAINLYTRYYEQFWNRLHSGAFFLLGGASLFAAGVVFELILRRAQREAS